ncbi:hypothetical protein EAI_08166 [Harpegnathos saltator]|uniref:Uncharacterized protein n=1 Tax=Harpegnathos saltator TaxID=610380 RepID=E2C1L6_HARSA|nr:hypothetical protein EAI_08166 [Harpegnathos saltator]
MTNVLYVHVGSFSYCKYKTTKLILIIRLDDGRQESIASLSNLFLKFRVIETLDVTDTAKTQPRKASKNVSTVV